MLWEAEIQLPSITSTRSKKKATDQGSPRRKTAHIAAVWRSPLNLFEFYPDKIRRNSLNRPRPAISEKIPGRCVLFAEIPRIRSQMALRCRRYPHPLNWLDVRTFHVRCAAPRSRRCTRLGWAESRQHGQATLWVIASAIPRSNRFSTIAPRFPIFFTANMPRGFPMLKLNRLFYASIVQSRK